MAAILVVDDESFVGGIVEEILTSEGHTVLSDIRQGSHQDIRGKERLIW